MGGIVFQYRYDDEIMRVDPAAGSPAWNNIPVYVWVVGRHNEVRAKRAMHAGVVTTRNNNTHTHNLTPERTAHLGVGRYERERERAFCCLSSK